MSAIIDSTQVPNFPKIPLRRQSAYGSMPIDFTRIDSIKYTQKLMNKLNAILRELSELDEQRESCEYQIGYYTNLLAMAHRSPADTADEDYDDSFDDYYTRYNITQRYKMEVYWFNTLEDEKRNLGLIDTEILILEEKKRDLTTHLKNVYAQYETYLNKNMNSTTEAETTPQTSI